MDDVVIGEVISSRHIENLKTASFDIITLWRTLTEFFLLLIESNGLHRQSFTANHISGLFS